MPESHNNYFNPSIFQSDRLTIVFRLSMYWRIIYGLLKAVTGFLLLAVNRLDPASLFYKLMRHEIIEDPGDVFIRLASPVVDHLSSDTAFFAAVYLLFWGLIDIFLAVNVLRRRLWAFMVALFLISLFIIYEIYRISYTHSVFLGVIIMLDMAIVWIVYKEYLKLKKRHQLIT
jgi:uncharacterized membrane protein